MESAVRSCIRNQSSIEALRGTYSVSVYSEYGCEGSDQAEVIWRDFPTVSFGPNMVDICPVNLPVEIEAQGDYENWTDMIWHDDLYEIREGVLQASVIL